MSVLGWRHSPPYRCIKERIKKCIFCRGTVAEIAEEYMKKFPVLLSSFGVRQNIKIKRRQTCTRALVWNWPEEH